MLCLLGMLMIVMNVHDVESQTSSWKLESQEDYMVGLSILNSTGYVTHNCLGVQIEGTAQVLTTCSCLGRVHGGQLVKPNITIRIHPNPSFLGWGGEEGYSTDFEFSSACHPRTHVLFPWASDLAIVHANGSFARRVEETTKEWLLGLKICTEDVKWSFRASDESFRTCYTYTAGGTYQHLYNNLVYLVPPRECETTICQAHSDICDVDLLRQGILCTTLPHSFADCPPVGAPLFCGSSVFGLAVRPQGATTTCDKWPVLLFQSVVPEVEKLIPRREEICRDKQVRAFSLTLSNEDERHLLIILNLILTLVYRHFRT